MTVTDWSLFSTIKTKDPERIPVVLSREEVRLILGLVREDRFRICLRLIYECGLRLGEGLRIETRDIDRAGHRLMVRQGQRGEGSLCAAFRRDARRLITVVAFP
jgi:integrase/recombinase XerD